MELAPGQSIERAYEIYLTIVGCDSAKLIVSPPQDEAEVMLIGMGISLVIETFPALVVTLSRLPI